MTVLAAYAWPTHVVRIGSGASNSGKPEASNRSMPMRVVLTKTVPSSLARSRAPRTAAFGISTLKIAFCKPTMNVIKVAATA